MYSIFLLIKWNSRPKKSKVWYVGVWNIHYNVEAVAEDVKIGKLKRLESLSESRIKCQIVVEDRVKSKIYLQLVYVLAKDHEVECSKNFGSTKWWFTMKNTTWQFLISEEWIKLQSFSLHPTPKICCDIHARFSFNLFSYIRFLIMTFTINFNIINKKAVGLLYITVSWAAKRLSTILIQNCE